ncbi:cell division initiation protein [Streptomyces sp. NPDC047315]|uniref:cell division initiation protein n=1 Tax=Streptomyces sp. NPDC047315 TaxID=3155142 RepID=UPI0033C19F4F
MDVHKKLDEIVEAVGSARSLPMSASCVVNRAELLALLEEVRRALPDSLARAQEVLGDRDRQLAGAREEARRIIDGAHAERGSLIADSQVARHSQDEAERIVAAARREAEEIRAEADEYVDSKLANFEVVLTKTIGSVDRGREKLLGRGPGLDEQGLPEADAPEYSTDPQILIDRADAYVAAKLGAFEAVLGKTLDAVGRGRLKLQGRTAGDGLEEHLAAQDAAGAPRGAATATSDADYLAGLAELADPPPPAAEPEPRAPAAPPYPLHAPAAQPAAYAGQDPYPYAGQDPYAGRDPYAAYGEQQQSQHEPAPAYARQEPQPYAAQGPYAYPDPDRTPPQQQPAALDETSFFDTGMIDMAQLRRYEQGH